MCGQWTHRANVYFNLLQQANSKLAHFHSCTILGPILKVGGAWVQELNQRELILTPSLVVSVQLSNVFSVLSLCDLFLIFQFSLQLLYTIIS